MEYQFQKLKLYPGPMGTMLHSPSGEVGKYLGSRCKFIMAASKRQVGVRTGRLRTSIHMAHNREVNGQSYWIGSNEKHAFMHHQGTKPHLIVPKQAQLLRFSVGARMVTTRSVQHPGTKPNRYLADQLYLVKF